MTTDVGRELAQLKQKVDRLQRASRLSSASLDDTALEVRDGTGSLRALVGQQADGTTAVNVVNGPPPPVPSAPIVASVLGGITVSWDGLFAGGAAMPLDWSRIEVHASPLAVFTPMPATLQSTIETPQGATVVIPTTGPLYVRLLARNTSGTASDPTAVEGPKGPTPVVASDVLDGIITTIKIADDAVTGAKVAAGAIDTEAIAAAAITAAQIAANAVITAAIAPDAVTATKIADGSITTPKLVANAVTANELNAAAVTAAKIAAGAVVAGKLDASSVVAGNIAAAAVQAGNLAAASVQAGNLAADSVQAGNIAADVITSRELQALSVVAGKIAANAVTATEISAGAITTAKLAAGSVDATALKADAITGKTITGGTITGTDISGVTVTGATVTGGTLQTGTTGTRVVITPSPPAGIATRPSILVYSGVTGELIPAIINAGQDPDNPSIARPQVVLASPRISTEPGGSSPGANLVLRAPKLGSLGGAFILNAYSPDDTSTIGKCKIIGTGAATDATDSEIHFILVDGDEVASDIYMFGSYTEFFINGSSHILNASGLSLTGGLTVTTTAAGPNGTYNEEGTWSTANGGAGVTFNSWVQSTNSTYQTLRLSKGAVRARLDGVAMVATAFSTGSQTAFTIPSGYRPLKAHYFAIPNITSSSPGVLGCRVGADGLVTIFTSVSVPLNALYDFSNVHWPLN